MSAFVDLVHADYWDALLLHNPGYIEDDNLDPTLFRRYEQPDKRVVKLGG